MLVKQLAVLGLAVADGFAIGGARRPRVHSFAMAEPAAPAETKPEGYGASHTSFYTDTVAKDSYDTLEKVLDAKLADKDLRSVLNTMFDACGTITEALRVELVTVAEKQESVFGDVQLGVDVLADNLMWDVCQKTSLIKEGASEEEPEVCVP
jgi:sedoheptulose-bisphosphatase